MLIGMKEMLTVAKENHFAVGAFNATQSELLRAVVEEAEATDTPAIIEVSFGEFSFATPDFYAYARERLGNSRVPFVLHLDHGHSLEECMRVMRAGFTSVMIDGSMLSYEENVEQTRRVVELAHMVGVDVEAEIGTIGKIDNSSDEGGATDITYTDPQDVVDFIGKTGADSLAVAIGTAHGLYPKGFGPKLRLDILEEIVKVSPVPLVLHGGSGNPDDEVRRACEIGIQKVNISSDFKHAFFQAVGKMIATGEIVPVKVLTPGIEAARKVIAHKMDVFGSVGKAACYR